MANLVRIVTHNNFTTQLEKKVDKVEGKGLSDVNFTQTDKDKLDSLENYDDTVLSNKIDVINQKIPSQATSENKLADKSFVNSSIQTYTAFFDGSWQTYSSIPETIKGFTDLGFKEPTINNYLVVVKDENNSNETWRYKYTGSEDQEYNKSLWKKEYKINDTALTSDQIKAINSGISSEKITEIDSNISDRVKYTDIASATKTGVIKIGSDFDINTDGTLSLYKSIDITEFKFTKLNDTNINSTSISLDKGTQINNLTLKWTLNKVASTVKLNDTLIEGGINEKEIIYDPPIDKITTQSYTLNVQDVRLASKSMTRNISFMDRVYYGISDITDISLMDSDFIKGLATSTLASSVGRTITINCTEGKYIYFCCPSNWNPTFKVGGFEGGFSLIKTLNNFVNPVNYSDTNYKIFKSTNSNLGTITISIS